MTDWTIGQWWLIGLPAPLLIFGDRVEWVGGGTESSNPVVTWLVLLALARTLGCFWRLLHSHNQKTPLSLYFRNSRVLGAGAWNCGGRPNIYLKNHSVYWVSFWDDGRCSRIKQWWSLFNLVNILCCSVAQLCPTLCDPMVYSTPGFPFITISWSLLRLMSVELVMPSNHVILSCPLLLLPSVFTSIRVFSRSPQTEAPQSREKRQSRGELIFFKALDCQETPRSCWASLFCRMSVLIELNTGEQ